VIENVATVLSSTPDGALGNNASRITTVVEPIIPPHVSQVTRVLGSPFKLRISGDGFVEGVVIYVADDTAPWATLRRRNDRVLVLGTGRALKARFPKGVAVRLRIVNPDGGEAEAFFAR
jgi:Mg2+/citrate symporter